MTLFTVLLDLEQFPEDGLIYAARPWTPESEARVFPPALLNDRHDPVSCAALNEEYFLEVAEAEELWHQIAATTVCLQDACQRLIEYALAAASSGP